MSTGTTPPVEYYSPPREEEEENSANGDPGWWSPTEEPTNNWLFADYASCGGIITKGPNNVVVKSNESAERGLLSTTGTTSVSEPDDVLSKSTTTSSSSTVASSASSSLLPKKEEEFSREENTTPKPPVVQEITTSRAVSSVLNKLKLPQYVIENDDDNGSPLFDQFYSGLFKFSGITALGITGAAFILGWKVVTTGLLPHPLFLAFFGAVTVTAGRFYLKSEKLYLSSSSGCSSSSSIVSRVFHHHFLSKKLWLDYSIITTGICSSLSLIYAALGLHTLPICVFPPMLISMFSGDLVFSWCFFTIMEKVGNVKKKNFLDWWGNSRREDDIDRRRRSLETLERLQDSSVSKELTFAAESSEEEDLEEEEEEKTSSKDESDVVVNNDIIAPQDFGGTLVLTAGFFLMLSPGLTNWYLLSTGSDQQKTGGVVCIFLASIFRHVSTIFKLGAEVRAEKLAKLELKPYNNHYYNSSSPERLRDSVFQYTTLSTPLWSEFFIEMWSLPCLLSATLIVEGGEPWFGIVNSVLFLNANTTVFLVVELLLLVLLGGVWLILRERMGRVLTKQSSPSDHQHYSGESTPCEEEEDPHNITVHLNFSHCCSPSPALSIENAHPDDVQSSGNFELNSTIENTNTTSISNTNTRRSTSSTVFYSSSTVSFLDSLTGSSSCAVAVCLIAFCDTSSNSFFHLPWSIRLVMEITMIGNIMVMIFWGVDGFSFDNGVDIVKQGWKRLGRRVGRRTRRRKRSTVTVPGTNGTNSGVGSQNLYKLVSFWLAIGLGMIGILYYRDNGGMTVGL